MKQLHPYLQIYLKSNGKFKKVLKHYMNSKKQNQSNTQNAVRKKCIKCINLLHYKHSHFYYFTNLLI